MRKIYKSKIYFLIILAALVMMNRAYANAIPIYKLNNFIGPHGIGSPTVTIDFDQVPYQVGKILSSGVTMFGHNLNGDVVSIGQLNYDIPGCIDNLSNTQPCQMMVDNTFSTTSGFNYLGLNDPSNFNQFIGGQDIFQIRFSEQSGVNAFGMFLISSDRLSAGDVILDVIGNSFLDSFDYGGIIENILDDGGYVYFLGVLGASEAITSISLRFSDSASGAFFYNVDDILVETSLPESSSLLLSFVGLLSLLTVSRFQNKA